MKTLQKFFLALLIFLSLNTQSFACGGCTDYPLGNTLAQQGKTSYDAEEEALFQSIENLNNLLENQIIKAEENALQEKNALLSLEKHLNLNEKKQNFYFKQHNELQSLINNIKAIR